MDNFLMTSFGEPEPVLDGRKLFEYDFCPRMKDYYEYPYDIAAVASLYRATSHHTSALVTKRNVLTSLFIPNDRLSRRDFESLVQNWLVFNNGYLQLQRSQGGLSLIHI